ncbi:MAG: hypothetical protein AAF990_23530, partial [Bacteroidota bacterium]
MTQESTYQSETIKPKVWFIRQYRDLRHRYYIKEEICRILEPAFKYYSLVFHQTPSNRTPDLVKSFEKYLNDCIEEITCIKNLDEQKRSYRSLQNAMLHLSTHESPDINTHIGEYKGFINGIINTIHDNSQIKFIERLRKENLKLYKRIPKIVQKYEDWLNGEYMNGSLLDTGVQILNYKRGGYELVLLPEEDREKIYQNKKNILEDLITHNLDWYIQQLEERLTNSEEKKLMVEREIE